MPASLAPPVTAGSPPRSTQAHSEAPPLYPPVASLHKETLVTRHRHPATTTKIRPRTASTCVHTHPSQTPRCPLTSYCPRHSCTPLLHFLHHTVRPVRRYTFLSGWQLPCPPSSCPNCTPHSPSSHHSCRTQVRPCSQPMLTTGRPLTALISHTSLFWATARAYTCALPAAAVLRDISEGTSYQAVRLVFRPYTHLLPSICTSDRLSASSFRLHAAQA
jgi:hypothetical protein